MTFVARLLSASLLLAAHPQPTSLLALRVHPDHIAAELHLPVEQLRFAFPHSLDTLDAYLKTHFVPRSPAGDPWTVTSTGIHVAPSGDEAVVQLTLTPPAGAAVRTFDLQYDAIIHQVVTHKAVVSLQSDFESGQLEPATLGVIAVDTATSRIAPLHVDLGAGNSWSGFLAMVQHGIQHIREGLDHLLFLLVLLLPATLRAENGSWASFAGVTETGRRLIRIVTAFTLGHSLTLLAGAMKWLQLPQQPVEVLIAVSVLLTAAHAIRPLFPGRETTVAAGFGLIHGLAFATVLSDLQLPPAALALSIAGFNLGIELGQLFAVAVTMPWLLLLSVTPVHRHVRVAGAILAAVAACAWIASRVSGQSNVLEQTLDRVTAFAPIAVLILAAITIPACLHNSSVKTAAVGEITK